MTAETMIRRRRLTAATRPIYDGRPKMIDGALDLMPAGPPWPQDEYEEWLAYFDMACRIYYRLPAAPTPPQETQR